MEECDIDFIRKNKCSDLRSIKTLKDIKHTTCVEPGANPIIWSPGCRHCESSDLSQRNAVVCRAELPTIKVISIFTRNSVLDCWTDHAGKLTRKI